jgi:hypothetical protein
MTAEKEWVGQEWPSAEKVALRKGVVRLIESGWPGANLTLFTRAAVKLALRDVEAHGLNSEVAKEAQRL